MGRDKAADDPALGLGKANIIKSSSLRDYLKEATGYHATRDYVSLTLELNFAWDWRGKSREIDDNIVLQATPRLRSFMTARPQAKLLLLSAYYDLATPMLAQRYALSHGGIPRERIQFESVASGHALYDDAYRASTAATLRRFILQ